MRSEDLLLAWDPLGYGLGSYGPEFDDITVALVQIDSESELNETIRRILTDSFGECPTEEDTRAMAKQLLTSSEACQL
ncbi:DUF1871 family protein [Exiguobacterium sp. SH1S21]|uniref:DUF1871 family protein n=1 Tax=Exiguobacterium sp. SH1S21 TaxID=2510953 RepID=UPI0010390384|nr:DUF1871 family protein [Exiguobacterium sp. SH1S21]TCI52272.1 DUF1871 family protein [Exiguobacterium sp. SH1S21]